MDYRIIDELFSSYNYGISEKSNANVRIYTLRYGMYHAAEIVRLNESLDVSKFKNMFSELGYATEVQFFENVIEVEEYLFEGFFIKNQVGYELNKRYDLFTRKQLKNLPEGSEYKYIDTSFNYMLQDEDGSVVENEVVNSGDKVGLISKINELILKSHGAIFIIIEAPAGFGKTCTAYEILNAFSANCDNKLPFFTELSRNREARIFKHILLNEINEQFPVGIKDNIVIDQIRKGRIPLIIDGFDELITRESTKEEIDSMLSTIIELLENDAKIVVTTRKTALFSSDDFFESVESSLKRFSIGRIEIKQPTINNWLSKDKLKVIEDNHFPKENFENPVLLAYLRNISLTKFDDYFSEKGDESLVDKYFNYLLIREKERQNIKLNTEEQLRIFRKLVRQLTELNVTTESKSMIKDLILVYNKDVLESSLIDYSANDRPSLNDLVETLSNHAFLDRKKDEEIGFVNDFIFGTLIGQNLLLGKYQKYYENYTDLIPQDFALKALQAFKIQKEDRRFQLWEIINEFSQSKYDVSFNFYLDYHFSRKLLKTYNRLILDDWSINDIQFGGSAKFNQSVFTKVLFSDCMFDLDSFENCTFQNCTFQNCYISSNESHISFNDFALFDCSMDNDFNEKVLERVKDQEGDDTILTDLIVLNEFFIPNRGLVVPRSLMFLKGVLKDYSKKSVNKRIASLKKNLMIHFKDDMCFVTKKGLDHYKRLKTL